MHQKPVPKGYLVAHVNITDAAAYAIYSKAAGEAIASFSTKHVAPKIVAVSGKHEHLEGGTHTKHMVIEFDSFADAKAFYESPEYQAAKALRAGAATGNFVLLEGTV
ncbi:MULTISPECIES: DUF1330 domain-containing protein [unclassified Paraburkholderia]|uniref:DUF1330 domain-containing protein n=1 Tax=unclassified Paraburkholderia TaxID=2615204 RepID=UPI0018433159|nr:MULTISPECIES: DUF1330 domain-containing protein [unclassified Paraburkholderia]MBB5447444.1 uncharacterized protein (DUF1330 family) [Paraburkholderia sp. WSM4177]MBB5487914.1 uncharacterized protein (DUF1330 family) [Paraburkholderia sp. WSM4180]